MTLPTRPKHPPARHRGLRRYGLLALGRLALLALVSVTSLRPSEIRAQQRTGRDFPQGVKVDLEYSYYEVEGRTVEEVYRSLQSQGPEVDGNTYYALTGVETGFRYRHSEDGGTCTLADIGVQARVVMRIPQWMGQDAASASVRRAWAVFLNRLMRHESQHYGIIEKGAHRIYNALRDLRVHSCDLADARAQQVIQQISEDQTTANEVFDRETHHGAREGAVWPPEGYFSTP